MVFIIRLRKNFYGKRIRKTKPPACLRLAGRKVFLHLLMSLKQELISGGSGKPVYGNSLTGRFFPVLFRSSERTLE